MFIGGVISGLDCGLCFVGDLWKGDPRGQAIGDLESRSGDLVEGVGIGGRRGDF